jgi:hypothetical protein
VVCLGDTNPPFSFSLSKRFLLSAKLAGTVAISSVRIGKVVILGKQGTSMVGLISEWCIRLNVATIGAPDVIEILII